MLSGRQLGDFAVGELLGAGGFGAVYNAVQISLDRPAVVKVLHASHRSDPEIIERFLREAQLASSLEHPYAAHVYAFGAESDGLMWIAMERVRGTGLDVLLRTRGPLPLATFVPLLERISEVVYTANEAGIIHRDLKPANVMVMTRAGQVLPKLLDFGIAKAIDVADEGRPADAEMGRARTAPITKPGPTEQYGVIGSPHYMAPEQWHTSAPISASTDVYALGVLTYEVLTGRLPFDATTVAELGDAHARSPVPPLGGDLPVELDAVLSRAMAKKPKERFATALELAAEVRAAAGLDGEIPLPRLDPRIRDGLLSDAPEPVAEAITVLDAASNPHQARDAVLVAIEAIYRYVGLLALAARSRVGPGEGEKTAVLDGVIVSLRHGRLDPGGHKQLAQVIAGPFAERADAFPLPELVSAVADPAFDRAANLGETLAAGTDTAQVREWLAGALEELAALADAVDFIRDYPLVIPRPGYCEWWMGARRSFRGVVPALEGQAEPGQPLLTDLASRPVLALWPLMMTGEPAPGIDPELFLLEGRSREGFARLTAVPSGFELHAPEPWEWLRRELTPEHSISGVGTTARAPYPGLVAFTRADSDSFVGREREAEELLNRMRLDPLVVVVGPSGAGKSSFVQAGVLPLLPDSWDVIVARPGSSPLAALAAHLEKAGRLPADTTASQAAAALRDDPGRLGAWLRDEPVVVVIDQLEELFTLCLDEQERAAYAEAVSRAASDPTESVRVIATLRDDFLLRAETLPGLRRRLARGLQLLTTPAPEELRRMLVEPARRAGFTFDDETLPDEMIDAVAGTPGALALLAFTASRLWDLRDRHFFQLTRKAYVGMGGVGGALAQHAEHCLEQLPGPDRELVREAFRHLVTAEGTRAVLPREDLEQLLGGGDRAASVIEHLIASRLLVAGEDPGGDSRVEVAHEALIEAWPRLARWRHEDAEGARLRDQIRSAARQWNERDRPRGLLWRGDALLELELWRKRFGAQLTRSEQAFVDASAAETSRGRRIRGALLALAMIGLAATAAVLLRFYRTADAERHRAESQLTHLYQEQGRQATLAGEPMRALAYLEKAYRRGARGDGIELMISTALESLTGQHALLTGHRDRLLSIAFAPAGDRLITGSGDGTARVWKAASGELIAELASHDDMVNSAAVSPDGQLAFTGGSDGVAIIWDLETHRPLHRLAGHEKGLSHVELVDDERLLTVGRSGLAVIWSVETGEKLLELRGHADWLWDAAISDDGRWIATGSHDRTARIWNSRTGESVATLEHGHAVSSLSFSGDRLLTASWDGKARIWTRGGRLLRTLDDHGGPIWSAAFSPDGTLVVTGSQDETAKLWRADTGEQVAVLGGHDAPVLTAAFSPDSERVATAGHDEVIRLWNRSGRLLAEHAGHTDTVWRLAFSPDGELLASASFDHTGRVWSATRSRLIDAAAVPTVDATGIDASSDGRRIAVSAVLPGKEGRLILWEVGGQLSTPIRDPVPIRSAAFSPGGAVAVGRADGRVELFDVGSQRGREVTRLEGEVHSVAFVGDQLMAAGQKRVVVLIKGGDQWSRAADIQLFEETARVVPSADGRLLAAGSSRGEVGVWTLAGSMVWRAHPHTLEIKQLAFTGDGRLISASADKTAHIVKAETGDRIGRIEADAELSDLALLSDDVFATSSAVDGVLRLWSIDSSAQVGALPTTAGVVKLEALGGWKLAIAENEQLRIIQLPQASIDVETLGRLTRCLSPFEVVEERLVRKREPDVQGCAKLIRAH